MRRGSPEWVARVVSGTRRGKERERERRRLRARDLAELRTGKIPVCDAILPHVAAAEYELEGFLEALGGADAVSPQRRALLEDVARVGVALRSELQRYAEMRDPDCASRLSSLVAARRSNLTAVGLDRVQRDALDLHSYLAARSNGANGAAATIDAQAAVVTQPADDLASGADCGHEKPAERPLEAELGDARSAFEPEGSA